MSIEEIHEDKWPSFLPKPYSGNDKHQQLKDFVQAVTATVLKDVSPSLIRSEHINDTKIQVVQKIINTQDELTRATGEILKLGLEIDNLNMAHRSKIDNLKAAHKSEIDKLETHIDQLNIAHKAKIDSMKWSFSEAALQTWPYPKENSDRPPATDPDHIPQPSVDPEIPAGTCVICLDQKSSVACFPCGHICMCQSCSQSVPDCPICRQPIQERKQIYICKKMPAPANPFFI